MATTPSYWSSNSGGSISARSSWSVFESEVLETRPGLLVASVTGRGAEQLFARESGGHRWQRIPPTEKWGRVHTSTVTVVVLPEPTETELVIDPRDLEEKFTRGSGAGGQHRNKTSTAVQLRHVPSGVSIRAENGRSQVDNRATARQAAAARRLTSGRPRAWRVCLAALRRTRIHSQVDRPLKKGDLPPDGPADYSLPRRT